MKIDDDDGNITNGDEERGGGGGSRVDRSGSGSGASAGRARAEAGGGRTGGLARLREEMAAEAQRGAPAKKAVRRRRKEGEITKVARTMKVVVGPDGMAKIDIPPEVLTNAIEALEENLQATKAIKVGDEWDEVPDYAVRQKAIETLLAYGVGLPVQRQIQIRGNFTSWEDKLAKVAGTPEGQRMLEEAGIVSQVSRMVKPPNSAFIKGGDSISMDKEGEK